jgi:hypothetical protein
MSRITLVLCFWVCLPRLSFAEGLGIQKSEANIINIERLADAIYQAEGGIKTRFPYGILTKYKHTTPRQACINTIKHALRDYRGTGDFITYLGKRYCPIGCDNDNGTNQYWIKNVKFWYEKLRKKGANGANNLQRDSQKIKKNAYVKNPQP